MSAATPTPYPEVNAVVGQLLAGARAVLGEAFVGMYLYGSLAAGGFDSAQSDIDFVVVTRDELPDDTVAALAAMHAEVAAGPSKWATEIEGSYLSLLAVRRYDRSHPPHPRIERGSDDSRLFRRRQDADGVIQRHVLRTYGITLSGPPPNSLVDPVSPDDLRRAVLAILHEYYAVFLDDPAQLRHDGYHAYTVQSLCRIRYTLAYGAVVPKRAAARWAQVATPEWDELIERAITWRLHLEDVGETLKFLRVTLDWSRPWSAKMAGCE